MLAWVYLSMECERTADMVSRMQPNSPASNCVKKDRLEKKGWKPSGHLIGGSKKLNLHLLNMLLQKQQQVTEVTHTETRNLKQNKVRKGYTRAQVTGEWK